MEYRQIGKFRLVETIASGGMGEILKCLNESDRPVAIKTILKEYQNDAKIRELFLRESEITFSLDHPNIIKSFGFDRMGQQLVLVLEYLEGVNLKQILRRVYEKKLIIPLPIVFEIMRSVLRGLDYAHKRTDSSGIPLKIVHRDLNPSNIFVTYAGGVKILDFGISKALGNEMHNLTPKGQLRGKMCYLSPEQIAQEALDGRSDVFAAGIVMWELITGQPLFLRDSNTEVLQAIQRSDYKPVTELRSDIPAELDALLQGALAPSMQNRFKDCKAFEEALNALASRSFMPGTGSHEISVFVRSIFNVDADLKDPLFLSTYGWLLTQIPGQELRGLQVCQQVAREHPSLPVPNLMFAKAMMAAGKKIDGLRMLRRLARVDSLENRTQEILEWLGVRRRPVVPFLKRSNPINHLLGMVRHKVMGPTPYQQEFLAA